VTRKRHRPTGDGKPRPQRLPERLLQARRPWPVPQAASVAAQPGGPARCSPLPAHDRGVRAASPAAPHPGSTNRIQGGLNHRNQVMLAMSFAWRGSAVLLGRANRKSIRRNPLSERAVLPRRARTWAGEILPSRPHRSPAYRRDSARGRAAVVTACAGAIGTAVTKALQEAGNCTAPLRSGEKIAPVDQPGSCLSHLQRPALISTPGTTASAAQSRHRPSRSQATRRAVNGARTSRPALPRSGESPRSGDDQSPAWWQT
jgi:hypothetical protein